MAKNCQKKTTKIYLLIVEWDGWEDRWTYVARAYRSKKNAVEQEMKWAGHERDRKFWVKMFPSESIPELDSIGGFRTDVEEITLD